MKLVVCGDSFNCGIGCNDLSTQPYGVLLARSLGMELTTLARGGASNYTVHLQAEYAIRMSPKVVIIGTTSYDRFEWVSEDKKLNHPPTALNINYHEYPPHHGNGAVPYYFEGRMDYKPMILTEQAGGIEYFVRHRHKEGAGDYFKRYHNEPIDKLQLMIDYYVHVSNGHIDEQYDISTIFKAYTKVNRAGIRCIVLTDNPELLELIGPEDTYYCNWFSLAKKYPDTVGSGHASPEAHALVAEALHKKLEKS